MNWHDVLLGEEDWAFLWEIPLRAAIMFAAAIVVMRAVGKRAIPQGVFEVLIIVVLGSAAGDPLLYSTVGVLPALISFIMIVVLYKALHYLIGISVAAEHLIEGKHVKLLSDGKLEFQNFAERDLKRDEIFADMRAVQVSQLGQLRAAYIEASGKMSIFFCEDEDVRPGLPIFPDMLLQPVRIPTKAGDYACVFCGNVQTLRPDTLNPCDRCSKENWLEACSEKRIS